MSKISCKDAKLTQRRKEGFDFATLLLEGNILKSLSFLLPLKQLHYEFKVPVNDT